MAGLIYCHRITDNRTSGSPKPNLRMFSKLTGSDTFEKVTLLQTMWDGVKPDVGQRRDKELRDSLWKPAIDDGAMVVQFRDSVDESWAVVSRSVEVHINTDSLSLQKEMVSARKQVAETPAGKELYGEYERLLQQQRQRLRDFQSQEVTPEMREQVESEIHELDEKLEKTFQEIRKLRIPLFRKLMNMFKGSSKPRYAIHFLCWLFY